MMGTIFKHFFENKKILKLSTKPLTESERLVRFGNIEDQKDLSFKYITPTGNKYGKEMRERKT